MNICQKIKEEYQELQSLKERFVLEYKNALETKDLAKAKKLKAELEKKKEVFEEKIFTVLVEKRLKEFEEKSLTYIEDLLNKGADKDWVAMGLAGYYITFVWRLRPKKKMYKFLKKKK